MGMDAFYSNAMGQKLDFEKKKGINVIEGFCLSEPKEFKCEKCYR